MRCKGDSSPAQQTIPHYKTLLTRDYVSSLLQNVVLLCRVLRSQQTIPHYKTEIRAIFYSIFFVQLTVLGLYTEKIEKSNNDNKQLFLYKSFWLISAYNLIPCPVGSCEFSSTAPLFILPNNQLIYYTIVINTSKKYYQ